MLEVRLLGQFYVQLDGRPVDIPSRPAQLLLAYLLLNAGTPQRREKLSGLFWPDAAESNARSNLRHAVWRLRKALEPRTGGPTFLLADNFSVSWNAASDYWVDVAVLERAAQQGTLEEQAAALSVYHGELLPGFYADWAGLERERLAAVFAMRMQVLLDGLAQSGRWADTVSWAERWIALGQAPEPAFRALMHAHGAAGDLAAVAASYQRCQEALLRDLGVEPSEQTRRLFEVLRQPSRLAAAGSPQVPAPSRQPLTPPTASGLPALSTTFVGREHELRQVADRLRDPSCRLLTLIGPGGIGKTRLAIQAAAQADQFGDGVQFVRLSTVSSADALVSAIAEALSFSFYGRDDATAQLVDYLRPKSLLLLLDNFEHLLDGAEVVATILRQAPGLKFLVTSQERLNLQDEWLLEVEGLPVPDSEAVSAADAANYGAVQLFVECARRADAAFRLRPDDLPAVLGICRLMAGMPLGIELAAAWVRAISIPEIAHEIERGVGFLSTSQRDRPERHRSLQAVFDHSWNRLTAAERQVFCRLTLFSGGFGREAAEQVAGATLADLSALVDKSLLRRLGSGRYAMHGLLRDFARAKLEASGDLPAIRDRHLDFYLDLAAQADLGLRGPDQLEWLRRLDIEHDNLRRALKWAAGSHASAGQRLAGDLARYWYLRGHWREGREWLATMLALTTADGVGNLDNACARSARAKALMGAGWLADEDGSEEPFYREALELCRAVGDDWGAAYSLRGLGAKLSNDGSLAQSEALLQEGLASFEARDDPWGMGLARHNLGWVAFGQEDFA